MVVPVAVAGVVATHNISMLLYMYSHHVAAFAVVFTVAFAAAFAFAVAGQSYFSDVTHT